MALMWFGDLVTLRWWDDIWLNESFAEYMGYQILTETTRYTDTWADFGVRRKNWGYDADQRPSTHPVAPENVDDTASALLNFDGISYAKGASALRQLVEWVGDDAFITGLRDHFSAHAYGNATLADLVGALSRSSGRDVAGWADRWLRTSGVSTLAVRMATEGDRYAGSQVVQRSGGTPRPHRIRVGLYDLDDAGTLTRRRLVATDVAAAEVTPFPALDGERAADLVLPNDGDLTFALLDLDERSASTVRSHLAALRDPMARALLWMGKAQVVAADAGNPQAQEQALRGAAESFRRAADRAGQLGDKDPAAIIAPYRWVEMIREALGAGATQVVCEGRASGDAGMYRPDGFWFDTPATSPSASASLTPR